MMRLVRLILSSLVGTAYPLIIALRTQFRAYELERLRARLCRSGKHISILPPYRILNPKYISIGDNFSALDNLRVEAWDRYGSQAFQPVIRIGNNVSMNTNVHVGCVNEVVIGNNVLIASRVFISDHSHGDINKLALEIPPVRRPLASKGPVIIRNNVWIGEGVCILAGVTIGENAIIGANAVVTTDIPANSVAVGIPARVIKSLV